ncbi:MAG: hypothetical protein GY737_24310 [Desulfobacteraceae bacterium]|nr:hypothetical protein [Desulfobacteraceae bacterium]
MAQGASAGLVPALETDLETELAGYVETRHCFQAKSPNDTLASETLARVEGRASTDALSLFASVNLSANHRFGDESGVSVHEAYVDYVSSAWDLRAGRQIITWGNADGVRITDNISPSDLSEHITRDFDEIRMAVDALKFRFFGAGGTAELIYIPFFKAGILPDDDSPWAVGGFSPADTVTESSGDAEPGRGLENGEIAAKYAFFLPGFDFALSYFYTWNDFPYYAFTPKAEEADDTYFITPGFHRLHITGLEFSKPHGDFVFRGEAALFHGGRYSSREKGGPLHKKDQVKWLLGVDWYPGGNWSLLCQVTGESILGYSDGIARDEHTTMVTWNLSRKLLREKLTLSGMHYYTLDEGDSLIRLSGEYEVMDGFSLFLGSDIFKGDRAGDFGRYRDNTQVWVKAKYSF